MQICLAKGANVYVTSGNEEKIQKAVSLGAKGGANYKESKPFRVVIRSIPRYVFEKADAHGNVTENWPSQIGALLAKNSEKGTTLDAIIDSAGGDIMGQAGKILKQGGRVVCYGM